MTESRILILMPTGKDAVLAGAALSEAGMESTICGSLDDLIRQMSAGAGALLVTEEAIAQGMHGSLAEALGSQPPWSDLPVLLLTKQGADSPAVQEAVGVLGNVILLERPIRMTALRAAALMALRARRRQYQLREHIADREKAAQGLREFLAMLAHELRNPLAPVRNGLLLLKDPATGEEARRRVKAMMERQVGLLVRLVDDLMEVSRITRGRIDLKKEPLDLSAVVRAALETSQPLIEAARHELRVVLPEELIVVEGDAVRLAQVFSNLLNNAARYTPEGGTISIVAGVEEGEAVIRVRDNGMGIPPEMLPRVFDMFMQADSSAARSQAGLGIGLTLVRGIVAMHGGRVEAHSRGSGLGSEFVVRIPCVEPPASLATGGERELETLPALGTVMVVDDNRDAADSLAMLLERLGGHVRVAYDGHSALEMIEKDRPDVVFLDIGMPELNGYEVARRIRSQSGLAGTCLVAVTGWSQPEQRLQSREAGFDHHLVKPADPQDLRSLLTSLVLTK